METLNKSSKQVDRFSRPHPGFCNTLGSMIELSVYLVHHGEVHNRENVEGQNIGHDGNEGGEKKCHKVSLPRILGQK